MIYGPPVPQQREYKEIPTEMTMIDYVPVERKVTHLQPMEEVTGYIPIVHQEPTYKYMPVPSYQEKVYYQPIKNTVPLPFQRFVPTEVYQSQLQNEQPIDPNYNQQSQNEQNPQNQAQTHVPINQTNRLGTNGTTYDKRRRNDYDTLN